MIFLRRVFWSLLILTVMLTNAVGSPDELQQAARRFRMRTYATFRQNRPEYDRRLAMAEQALNDWRDRGADPHEMAALIQWFRRAPSANPLPAPPFVGRSFVSNSDRHPEPRSPNRPSADASPHQRSPQRDAARQVRRDMVAPRLQPVEQLPVRTRPAAKAPALKTFSSVHLPPLSDVEISRSPTPAEATSIALIRAETVTSPPHDEPPINLKVLAAKIRSSNLSLQAWAERLSDDRLHEVSELESVMAGLNKLMDDQRLILIYVNAIPHRFQANIPEIADPVSVLGLLAERAFECKVQFTHDDPSTSREPIRRLNKILGNIQAISRQSNRGEINHGH